MKDNAHIFSILIIYENREKIIFKVLSSVVYCIIEKYLCADYLCFQQAKLHFVNKIFENKKINDISGIRIPELLMNIISCHGFVNDKKSTIIFSCCSKLVDYYVSKGFYY